MKKKTKVLLIVIVLAVVAGGFFYWLSIWESREPLEEKSQPPTLFSKEDYKIEQREDGKFIVVEKVGLTCKVPEGWKIEIKGDDIPEPEYWVNLYSPGFATTTGNVLKKGCIISAAAQTAQKKHEELAENIQKLQENPQTAIKELKEDYVLAEDFQIRNINDTYALELTSSENSLMGGGKNINIPLNDHQVLTFGIGFPLENKENCLIIWEEFLENIVIE